jgi:anti-sigma B factor antagonist
VGEPQFSVRETSDGPVLVALGELDLAVRDQLRAALSPLSGTVTLDLSAVTFIDSSAIGVFAGAYRRLTDDGGTLRLRDPQDVPRRALETVGLGDLIDG